MRIIKSKGQKVKGKGGSVELESGDVKRPAKVVDLMERLRQSLAQKKATPAKVEKRPRHPRRHGVV